MFLSRVLPPHPAARIGLCSSPLFLVVPRAVFFLSPLLSHFLYRSTHPEHAVTTSLCGHKFERVAERDLGRGDGNWSAVLDPRRKLGSCARDAPIRPASRPLKRATEDARPRYGRGLGR